MDIGYLKYETNEQLMGIAKKCLISAIMGGAAEQVNHEYESDLYSQADLFEAVFLELFRRIQEHTL